MKLPQVTRILLTATHGSIVVAGMAMAFGTSAYAAQSEPGEAAEVVITPQDAAEAARPELVPPAPEETVLVAVQAEAADPFPASPGDEASSNAFGIQINPANESSASVKGRSYEDVYRSIPYNYTEYLANPGYRHDATMEILFGELRPTTIVRGYEPKVIENLPPMEYQPYRWSHSERWQYRAPDFRLLDPGCCR